jgi:hypothetical protein
MEALAAAFNVSGPDPWIHSKLTGQDPDLAYTSGLGFATVGANNGHNGTSGLVSPFNLFI